ncbi:polysaccharide pyruvyl transferase family protein [Pseudonocardia sp. TRM90224]|uniref:polysaccharide pyruvyl transferase family protein n=1 Tax=Pseudonocardia sp. TRM90224 TaxID=2812678 RepID=UPI001E53B773|nr:polysaccharide pyruvyl transferase family protein [Pseudonocardia sp. TRM90224]
MNDSSTAVIREQLAELGRRHAAEASVDAARPRATRVLIIGNFGNGNTGDEAMLARTLQELPPDSEVKVVSRNPRMVEALHGVPAVAMEGISFTKALKWCDGIAVVGGGMFGTGASPLVRALPAIVWAATARGRDITYLAVGVYPGTTERTLDLLRRSVRKPGRISVRDEVSAKTLGTSVRAPVVGDLAMGLDPAAPAEAEHALAAAGLDPAVPLLIVAPKALPNPILVESLQDAAETLARRWIERGGAVAGLAISTHADYGLGLSRRDEVLINELGHRLGRHVPVLGPQLPPALAKAIVGEADALFGLRLHALVFAASMGVPCLGVGWEERTIAFLAEHEQSAITTRPPADELVAWVDRTLPARWSSRPRLLSS